MHWKRHPRKRVGFGSAFSAAGDTAFNAGGDGSGIGQPIAFVALGVWWSIMGIPQPHPEAVPSPPLDAS